MEREEKTTGMGNEAAEGVHAARADEKEPVKRTSLDEIGTGRAREGGRGDAAHSGSEPLEERTYEHESGYGGDGGAPRTSSDEREPLDRESREGS